MEREKGAKPPSPLSLPCTMRYYYPKTHPHFLPSFPFTCRCAISLTPRANVETTHGHARPRPPGSRREGGELPLPPCLGRAYGSCPAQYGLGTGGTDGIPKRLLRRRGRFKNNTFRHTPSAERGEERGGAGMISGQQTDQTPNGDLHRAMICRPAKRVRLSCLLVLPGCRREVVYRQRGALFD